MKRVKSGRESHRFMGRLLAGMTAAAVFVSSLAVPGNVGRVYAKETETGDMVFKEPEVRSINLNIDGKIAGLENPTVPESAEAEWSNGTGTYIYYAGMGRSRLLDADTTDFSRDGERGIFAVSDGQVSCDIYWWDKKADNGQKSVNNWKYSDMYLYLTGETGIESPHIYYPDNIAERLFSKAQMAALISNYNDSHKDWEEITGELGYAGLDGEKLFLLDAREIAHEEYGFSHDRMPSASRSFVNGDGWLRSPSISDDTEVGTNYYVDENLDVIKGAISSVKAAEVNNPVQARRVVIRNLRRTQREIIQLLSRIRQIMEAQHRRLLRHRIMGILIGTKRRQMERIQGKIKRIPGMERRIQRMKTARKANRSQKRGSSSKIWKQILSMPC